MISEEEVGCDGDAVCITDAVTENNLSTPFSLNVFLWTVGQSISLHDSPINVKFCLGMHYMHVLTFVLSHVKTNNKSRIPISR